MERTASKSSGRLSYGKEWPIGLLFKYLLSKCYAYTFARFCLFIHFYVRYFQSTFLVVNKKRTPPCTFVSAHLPWTASPCIIDNYFYPQAVHDGVSGALRHPLDFNKSLCQHFDAVRNIRFSSTATAAVSRRLGMLTLPCIIVPWACLMMMFLCAFLNEGTDYFDLDYESPCLSTSSTTILYTVKYKCGPDAARG